MTKPGRIPCCVPFCRRTAAADKYPDCEDIICGKHWRLAPKRDRRVYSRAYRRCVLAYAKGTVEENRLTFKNRADWAEWNRSRAATDRLWSRMKAKILALAY